MPNHILAGKALVVCVQHIRVLYMTPRILKSSRNSTLFSHTVSTVHILIAKKIDRVKEK
jgi:hypothetical protein